MTDFIRGTSRGIWTTSVIGMLLIDIEYEGLLIWK
jgi:hypothetical protein